MTTLAVRIRLATAADAAGIRMVATTAWTATYKEMLAPQNIAGFLHDYYSMASLQARLARPLLTSLVAERLMPPQAGEIVGYAFSGVHSLPTGVRMPGEGQLYALYVLPAVLGQGVGYRLWSEIIQRAREEGYARLWIGVLAANQRARRFYERQGARLDHTADMTIGQQTLPEVWYGVEP